VALFVLTLWACDHDPVAQGAELYDRTCVNCHGADGTLGVQVNGVAASDLTVVVPALSDEALATVIAAGAGEMPAQDLHGREIDDVIAYLRATFEEPSEE
jgi:mono/diheme cytochrome c family protein